MNGCIHILTFDYIESNTALDYNISFIMGDPVEPLDTSFIEIDSDGDYLANSYENTYGSDPFSPDTDNDHAMDSSDYSALNSSVIVPGTCANFSIPIILDNSTAKITIQIQKLNGTFDKTSHYLNYVNGTVDILPMIRIFSKEPYNSTSGIIYTGDYLPNVTAFANEYFAAFPLVDYKNHSWITELLYGSYHPAYTNNITLTFDFIWVALQNDTNGNLYPLHIWDVTHPVTIQGLFKTEILPNMTLILTLINNTADAPILFEYVHDLDPDFFNGTLLENTFIITNLTIFNFQEELQKKLADLKVQLGLTTLHRIPVIGSLIAVILGLSNILVASLEIPPSILNFPKWGIKDLVFKRLYQQYRLKSTWAAYLLDKGFSDDKFRFFMDVGGRKINFNLHRCEVIGYTLLDQGGIGEGLEVKLRIYKRMDNVRIFTYDETGRPRYYKVRRGLFLDYEGTDGNVYRLSYSGYLDENGILRFRLRAFDSSGQRVAITDVLNFRIKRPETGFSRKIYNKILDGIDALKRGLAKVLEVVTLIFDVISIPLGIWNILIAISMIGTVGSTIMGILLLTAAIVDIALAILGITAFVIVTLAAAGFIALGTGTLASIVSTSSAAGPWGILVAVIIVVILFFLWLFVKALAFEYANFSFSLPDKDLNYALSPEQGATLQMNYTLLNTGDARLNWYESRLSFGDNSYGDLMRVQYPKIIIIPGPPPEVIDGFGPGANVTLSVSDTIDTWGNSIDAILFAKFDFHDDLIWPPQFHYTALDLDLPVYPQDIQEFIDACEDDSISSRSRDAVVVWYGGNGGMWAQGTHTETLLYDENYNSFTLGDPPDHFNGDGLILDDELGSCWQAGFIPENRQITALGIWNGRGATTEYQHWFLDELMIYRDNQRIEWGKSDVLTATWYDPWGNLQIDDHTFDRIKFGRPITEARPPIGWCFFYINSEIVLEYAYDVGWGAQPTKHWWNYNN
ncbi:MAG: hypothetical protein ACTSRC_19335 [Candidatus Helarchaeota archaeon]